MKAASGVGRVLVLAAETTPHLLSERRINSELDRMQRLFEQAPGFMCVMRGPDHVYEIANRAYIELVARPDLIGRPVSAVVPEAIAQGFVALLDHVYASGEAYVGRQQRIVLRRADGGDQDERLLDFIYQPMVDEDGRVAGIFCQGIDVTDSARAARALAESEARFRMMTDDVPIIIWVTDAAGDCTYLNRRWYELTGQTPEQALGLGWTDATHPDDRDRVAKTFLEANTAQAAFRTEYRLRLTDGSYRWVLDGAGPRFDASGTYLGYVGSVIDIDDRHEDEVRIQVSESRFRAAVDAVNGYLWTNNAVGEMVGEQDGWRGLTGQSPSEYVGFGWASAVHPDDAAATVVAWQAAVANRSIFAHEHRVRRSDGVWRHFSIRAVPILDSAGDIVEWVGIHTDITEQRVAEAALLTLNNELEDRIESEVAGRLKVENSLRQSQKMDALGQLTGGIAHDFNNMLSIITSAFSMLRRRLPDADPSILHFVEVGQDAALRAGGLTKRMLAFARQEPVSLERVDINVVITDLIPLLTHSLGRAITIEHSLQDGIWPTKVDRNQLENAILNLAVNARDAIEGQGCLKIETRNVVFDEKRPDRLAGEFASLSFADNGAGMSEEVRAKVFEPFFTTKPAGKGTGLGLSQVYGFVRQADGGVEIVSAPQKGTRVSIYLPRTA
ncbi:MAG: PAS domain S-box protein [Sandarakinorhabdus sp.]|nr:PAS domain S-box protein [Sandarakinorhabdus sp.]